MSSFSTAMQDAILNHVYRNIALASPATVYAALFTTAPTDAGGGTEVTGDGYARQAMAFNAPIPDPSDTTRSLVANTAAITFATTHDPNVNVVAMGIYTAATGGTLIDWSPITSAPLGTGAEIRIPAGGKTMALS